MKAEVAELQALAAAADRTKLPGELSIPAELARRETWLTKIVEARAKIEARADARFALDQAEFHTSRPTWVRGHYAHAGGIGAGKPAESLGFGGGHRSKRPQNLDTRLPQDVLVNRCIQA